MAKAVAWAITSSSSMSVMAVVVVAAVVVVVVEVIVEVSVGPAAEFSFNAAFFVVVFADDSGVGVAGGEAGGADAALTTVLGRLGLGDSTGDGVGGGDGIFIFGCCCCAAVLFLVLSIFYILYEYFTLLLHA